MHDHSNIHYVVYSCLLGHNLSVKNSFSAHARFTRDMMLAIMGTVLRAEIIFSEFVHFYHFSVTLAFSIPRQEKFVKHFWKNH